MGVDNVELHIVLLFISQVTLDFDSISVNLNVTVDKEQFVIHYARWLTKKNQIDEIFDYFF